MTNEYSNLSSDERKNLLNDLWAKYSYIFNNIDPENIDLQNKKLDDLLRKIRLLNTSNG